MVEHEIEMEEKGLLAKKWLWLSLGFGLFALIVLMPTPQGLIEVVDKYGFAEKMIAKGVAHDAASAAWKAKVVIAILPLAVVFFATEALPIGVVGILMPLLAYWFHILPKKEIGKTFMGDAPLFLLGVLALGYAITESGLHKRIAVWILGWTRGFKQPIIVLCVIMSCLGSFISAHALAAFLAPVMTAIYYESVRAASRGEKVEHDPILAKMLLLTLCFAMNVGGVGSPAAGGRNALMLGFFEDYNVPMGFGQWMMYGFPLVPIMGIIVAAYSFTIFRGIKIKDLTPGIKTLKEEIKKMGPMSRDEKIMGILLLVILAGWMLGGEYLGLGGPALLAILIPVLFKVVDWDKMLKGISWDAWFMYCGAMTLGALLKETGAALWIAKTTLGMMAKAGMGSGFGLWVGVSLLSGLLTNFMSDAAVTALLGPITLPMGIFSGNPAEPWAIGLATAFATSFAHFLIVGTPNNAIVYGLGVYPDSGKRILHPFDFVKYGFVLWVICMVVLWVVGFGVIFKVVGFPENLLPQAQAALSHGG